MHVCWSWRKQILLEKNERSLQRLPSSDVSLGARYSLYPQDRLVQEASLWKGPFPLSFFSSLHRVRLFLTLARDLSLRKVFSAFFFLCFSFSVSRSVLFCLFLSVSFCFCLSIFLSQSNACNFLYHICMVPLLFSFFLLPSHAKRSHCDLGDNACDIESVMRVPRHIYDVRAELT